jgi:6-pyruvoyltetrahydropterin/6-carboxytetrahydropterin synthase
MYEINIITTIAAAHRLRGYKGKCEAIHGHNWKVEVYVQSDKLDDLGMVMDFKVLKKKTEQFLKVYDHKYLNEVAPFDKINPSSENLARSIYKELSKKINNKNCKVSKVKVWESDDAAANYYE